MAAKIIYGTAWKKQDTTKLVVKAVLSGFKAIDTACQPKHYREDLVGEALQELQQKHGIKREDLFLQTKYTPVGGHDITKTLPYDPHDGISEQVKSSFQKSLSNLRTTYLDSYLLHSPLDSFERTLEAWRVLIALQEEGKVRNIGLSNVYDISLLKALGAERQVQVVQNRWHEGNLWDRDVCRYCRENGIQYQSFWTLSGSPRLLAHPALLAIVSDARCTVPQGLFRIVQLEGITPLSGTTNEHHMKEDVAAENIAFSDSVRSHLDFIRSVVGA
jgi:diketogulonate reductase-like aldo/keto reductase